MKKKHQQTTFKIKVTNSLNQLNKLCSVNYDSYRRQFFEENQEKYFLIDDLFDDKQHLFGCAEANSLRLCLLMQFRSKSVVIQSQENWTKYFHAHSMTEIVLFTGLLLCYSR